MRWLLLVLSAGAVSCEKWHTQVEYDPSALEMHSVRHPQDYDYEGAQEVVGAYLAQVARGLNGPMVPYTACFRPEEAKKPFRFVSDTFAPGWLESAAELAIEIRKGPRLLFCLDMVAVNVSRFPCYECPHEKYVSVAAVNAMRARCGEAPYAATRMFDFTPDGEEEARKLLACETPPSGPGR